MKWYQNPWVQRMMSVAAAAGVYALAHKFPEYAKELAGLAALLMPSVWAATSSSPTPPAEGS